MDRPAGPGRLTVIVTLVLLCAIWGSTWLVIKTGLRELPPLTAAAARFTLAALVLALLAPFLHRREGGERPPPWLAIAMGTLNFAISYGAIYLAETVVPSGVASVLWAVFPLLTGAIAHRWLPGERLRPRQWAGLLLGLGGVAVLFVTDLRAIGPEALAAGALLLLSPLSAAVGQVVIKRHGTRVSATLLNRNGMLVGATVLWLAALPTESLADLSLGPAAIGSVLYLAVVGTAVTFGLYYWLLRFVSASRLSLIAYVTPAIALWLGWAVEGEPLALTTLLGTSLVLLGIAGALRR
ncbi:MAG: EamA family transporter [Myxococcales bacterium]|nr:EamA family transporter [Myxococcales bacterium]MCB9712454.1 EamA family transporter [Myxococcales bacterium]